MWGHKACHVAGFKSVCVAAFAATTLRYCFEMRNKNEKPYRSPRAPKPPKGRAPRERECDEDSDDCEEDRDDCEEDRDEREDNRGIDILTGIIIADILDSDI